MYNTYFFSTATVVVRIRHIVMLQVHCLYRATNEGRKNLHIVLNSKKFLYLHVYHQLLNDAISMCAFCLIDLCNYLRNNKTQDGSVCMYVCIEFFCRTCVQNTTYFSLRWIQASLLSSHYTAALSHRKRASSGTSRHS